MATSQISTFITYGLTLKISRPMKLPRITTALILMIAGNVLANLAASAAEARSGNPVFDGWYADPEAQIFGNQYWIYPTYSAKYDKQVFFDAFSSPDLIHWTKHSRILDTAAVKWSRRALWAPSVVAHKGKYYFFFGANDIQNDQQYGGIGIAVADNPAGPYHDYLHQP